MNLFFLSNFVYFYINKILKFNFFQFELAKMNKDYIHKLNRNYILKKITAKHIFLLVLCVLYSFIIRVFYFNRLNLVQAHLEDSLD